MDTAQQKIVQYLEEAQATERALIRVLQSQLAMTPRGAYRSALETHLRETRDHADRVGRRLRALGHGGNPLLALVGVAETLAGQALALGKTPLDLLRGTSVAEKVLKNAKDTSATEALEIATYTAIERLARDAGDDETATLAASIRADEERMLGRVMGEIPALTDAVLGRDFDADDPADSAGDLPIARYETLSAEDVVRRLSDLSQADLAAIDAYERRNQNRATVLDRLDALRGEEPWPGYDALTAAEVRSVLSEGDDARAGLVAAYERAHRNRAGVLRAAERERSNA